MKGPRSSGYLEIRLAGTGGQGLIMAGVILAEAAGVHDRQYATQSQSYGPEARGGASKSDVIISDRPILYPLVRNASLLLALSQPAYDKYAPEVAAGGTIIADDYRVERRAPGTIALPIIATARDQVGVEIAANIVGLGALVGITGIVTRKAMEEAIRHRFPARLLEKNLLAFELGTRLKPKSA